MTQPVALITDSLGGAVDDLVTPAIEAVNPIVRPTLRTTDPMLETVGGTVDGLVSAVDAVSPMVKPATAPVAKLLESSVLGTTYTEPMAPSPAPPIPVPVGGVVAEAEGLIPPPGVLADDVRSSAKPISRPASPDSVAPNHDATDLAESGEPPSQPAPAGRASSSAPASSASSAMSSSRDLHRTHDAMAAATALAHAAIPAALAPLGIRVVGASENSGSRPSATPD